MSSRRVLGIHRAALVGGVGALLLGAVLLLTSMHAAASATCPGRNGKVAVVVHPGREQAAIGVLGSKGRLRTVYKGVPENSIFDLSFSCDGKKIAFTEVGGSPSRALSVLNLATGDASSVPTQRLRGSAPAFLPDGRILFSGSRVDPNRMGGTFVVKPDGTGLRHLFGREQDAATPDLRWFVTAQPNGKLTALFLLNAHGKTVRRLTPIAPRGTAYLNPSISPDGRLIAYEERVDGPNGRSVLYLIRRDGTHRRRLTFGIEPASEPAFSPDGRWIAFTKSSVFALSVRHPRKIRKLGISRPDYQDPAWAPR